MESGLPWLKRIVDLAIEEDLGRGDVTTRLTVPTDFKTTGRAIARQDMVLSGGDIFAAVMHQIDPKITIKVAADDGTRVSSGELLLTAEGRVASLLMAERVALNFLQHLCGVATLTRKFVDKLPQGSDVRITDTRKTTPGMRFLERRAVLHGGGRNHRTDLGGGVLIKENHIAAAGSIDEAVQRCQKSAPHPLRIEVEVRTESELEQAIKSQADAVLLDNMNPTELVRCVEIARGRIFIEASGGVSLETVASIAEVGVDVISIGALTHSAPAADITFLIDRA
ncbi:MAG: carboxylating nicotinate-nucleotide diphosphorylase [Proteobacteria bacterium]|nr:carboxylating nicotinate-nucleotide diphosphorylase [Pseudomonadota bacterium]